MAVHPEHRLKGYGRQILAEAEKRLRALGCPKINLQVRTANRTVLEFYQRIGYRLDDVVSLGKRLEHDEQKLGVNFLFDSRRTGICGGPVMAG